MTTIEQQNKNRIEVVRFLREELEPRRFFIGNIIADKWLLAEELPNHKNPMCGTTCCVIGWTPAIFPDQVKWIGGKTEGVLDLNSTGLKNTGWMHIAEELFGVSYMKCTILFNSVDNYGSELRWNPENELVPDHVCSNDSTPKEVADRLEAYFVRNPLVESLVNEISA